MVRRIGLPISQQTIKDLIVAHLNVTTHLHHTDEVIDIVIGDPDAEGVHWLDLTIEPATHIINH